MSKNLFIAMAATTVLAFSFNTEAAPLSGKVKHSIARAIETGDEATISKAVKAAKKANPGKKSQIDAYVNNYNTKARMKAAAAGKHPSKAKELVQEPMVEAAEPAAGIAGINGLTGNVDAGLSVATGNTENSSVNANAVLNYVEGKWENKLSAKAVNDKTGKVRTKEQYLVNDKLKYNFTDFDYGFGELNYDNDRFSSFNYQMTEVVGYGRRFIKNPTTNLSGEIGIGARQTEFVNGIDESEIPVGKVGVDFDHKLTDTLQVGENAALVYGSEATVITSDTWLKNQLSKSLYLKANYNVKNVSDVPVGIEKTDTVTSINLGYEF